MPYIQGADDVSRKIAITFLLLIILLTLAVQSIYRVSGGAVESQVDLEIKEPVAGLLPWKKPLVIPRILSGSDKNGNGLDDLEDLVLGARQEVLNKTVYRDGYFRGGYPPDDEGVCTDVIWRAFRGAGYDLKDMVDQDIKNNLRAYPRVGGRPEPNIDFRRVQNLVPFFKRHAQVLTTEIIPGNAENLAQWQGGDIVVYGAPLWHIGIVSDKRRKDGVPLLIHNGGPWATEEDRLLTWPSPLIHHFRYPRSQ
jgi:uncharacterized protein YijF (DUF1287 family)